MASGRASALGSEGRGFESRPRHTKSIKMVPVATLLGAQHYKAPHEYFTTNFATLTKKSPKKIISVFTRGPYGRLAVMLNTLSSLKVIYRGFLNSFLVLYAS